MDELTIAEAIVKAGNTIGFTLLAAAFIRGFLNK